MEQRLATQLKDLILKKIVGMWWEAWLSPVTALGVVKCKVNIVKFISTSSSNSHWILKLYVSVMKFSPLSCTELSVSHACASLVCCSSTLFLILQNSKTMKSSLVFCLLSHEKFLHGCQYGYAASLLMVVLSDTAFIYLPYLGLHVFLCDNLKTCHRLF